MEKLRFLRKSRLIVLRLSFIPVIFIVLFVWRSWEDESITDFIVEWLGYLLLFVGIALRIWSTLYIGQKKSKQLITEGPFSMCRNPLYAGTLLIVAGLSMCFENFILLGFVLLIMIPVHYLVILLEEEILLKDFGSPYEEYKKRVPRLMFSFSKFHTPAMVEISTKALGRAAMEMILLVLIPPLGDLIEMLHSNGVLPVLWKY